jgi:acetyl-CoA carboxylase biotin carboxyl carrier protein
MPVDIVKPDKLPVVDAAAGDIVDVRPPLPGTFYRAPSPGAEPFTEVGQTVDADTILGLVETMKLMNSVVSGCRGEIVEICAANAQLVEAGDVLMRIRVADDG